VASSRTLLPKCRLIIEPIRGGAGPENRDDSFNKDLIQNDISKLIDLMHNDVTRLDAREECWS
jgi:hypothetical protein